MKRLYSLFWTVFLFLSLSSTVYAREGDVITTLAKPDWWEGIDFSEEWFNPKPNEQGDFVFTLGNSANPDKEKHLWFYMEHSWGFDLGTQLISTGSITGKSKTSGTADNGMQFTIFEWLIFPQPATETVRIFDKNGGQLYDGVIGYTNMASMCTPEPGTLFLLGSGLIGMAGLYRRKKNSETD